MAARGPGRARTTVSEVSGRIVVVLRATEKRRRPRLEQDDEPLVAAAAAAAPSASRRCGQRLASPRVRIRLGDVTKELGSLSEHKTRSPRGDESASHGMSAVASSSQSSGPRPLPPDTGAKRMVSAASSCDVTSVEVVVASETCCLAARDQGMLAWKWKTRGSCSGGLDGLLAFITVSQGACYINEKPAR